MSVIKEIEGDFDDFDDEVKEAFDLKNKVTDRKKKLPMDADADDVERKRPRLTRNRP